MLSIGPPESANNPRVYRFAGVELDVERLQLRIDGQATACPRKAFELLLLLCRAPETVLPRQQIQDALWPGGQVVSDEALTQAIFRARSALGPYGGLIATVRSVGLRLDAAVTTVSPVAPRASRPEPATVAAEPGRSGARALLAVQLALVVLLLAVVAWFAFRAPQPELLDAGYGLTRDDILSGQPETAAMLVEVFESEANGERARGAALLEAVHRSDERTPIPALFLALWSDGTATVEAAQAWLDQARARIADNKALYPNLLLDYVAAEVAGDTARIIHTAGALLDLRPGAWRMHHARAHLLEYSGMREAALREISQIRVDRLDDRKLAQTIADRASMGDIAGAQAALDSLSPASDPATHAFLSGRVAWSRGDFDAAHGHFMAAVDRSYDQARMDIHRRCLIYAGAIEAMWGQDDQALSTLERARNVAGNRSQIDEADVAMLMAQLHFQAGRLPEAFAELDRALALAPGLATDGIEILSHMLALRIRPEIPMTRPDDMPPEAEALWRSANAVVHGERDVARQALAEALNLGILDSRMADEARWLQLQLGLPLSAEAVIDPPYPPLSRIALRRQIRQSLAANDASPGPLRP
jgi:DNA-binding winged helix-turn-helix (wHTH) protein/tetratricopeptide (TPR) repeat protein